MAGYDEGQAMSDVKLLPCPFCGEPAEIDTRQAFRALSGVLKECVAIYCTVCTVQAQHCYSDHPGEDHDGLRDDLIAVWNRRACVEANTAAQAAEIYDLGLRLDAAIERSIESDRAESRLLDEIEALREQVSRLDEVNVELGRQLVEHEDRAERLAEALRLYMAAGFGNSTDFYKQAEAQRAAQAALHPTAAQEGK